MFRSNDPKNADGQKRFSQLIKRLRANKWRGLCEVSNINSIVEVAMTISIGFKSQHPLDEDLMAGFDQLLKALVCDDTKGAINLVSARKQLIRFFDGVYNGRYPVIRNNQEYTEKFSKTGIEFLHSVCGTAKSIQKKRALAADILAHLLHDSKWSFEQLQQHHRIELCDVKHLALYEDLFRESFKCYRENNVLYAENDFHQCYQLDDDTDPFGDEADTYYTALDIWKEFCVLLTKYDAVVNAKKQEFKQARETIEQLREVADGAEKNLALLRAPYP